MLSRLIPFATLLLMTAPLLGIAYSFGGVSETELWGSTYLLLLAAVQVSAIAIACSTAFGTSIQAFVATYIVSGIFLHLGPMVLVQLTLPRFDFQEPQIAIRTLFGHSPIHHYGWLPGKSDLLAAIARTWPVVVTSLGWILLARLLIIRRAFARPANLIGELFYGLDRVVGTFTFWTLTTQRRLPDTHPIAWRETQSGALGSTRNEVYAMVLVEILVLLWIAYLKSTTSAQYAPEPLMNGMLLMMLCAALIISARSISVFCGERARQTLDVLLTTPLTNREILTQKFHGVRNIIALLLIPTLTFTVFFAIDAHYGRQLQLKQFGSGDYSYYTHSKFDMTRFDFVQIATLISYPQMIAWLGIVIGMRFKRITVGLVVMLSILTAWAVLPLLILIPLFEFCGLDRTHPLATLLFLSPVVVPATTMFGDSVGNLAWTQSIISVLWHTGCWLGLRRLAHRQLEHRLGRRDQHSRPRRMTEREPRSTLTPT